MKWSLKNCILYRNILLQLLLLVVSFNNNPVVQSMKYIVPRGTIEPTLESHYITKGELGTEIKISAYCENFGGKSDLFTAVLKKNDLINIGYRNQEGDLSYCCSENDLSQLKGYTCRNGIVIKSKEKNSDQIFIDKDDCITSGVHKVSFLIVTCLKTYP